MTVRLTVYGQTDIGLARKSNEDSFVIGDLTGGSLVQEQHIAQFEVGQRGLLLAVSDGMGGHQAGEVASVSLSSRFVARWLAKPAAALLTRCSKRRHSRRIAKFGRRRTTQVASKWGPRSPRSSFTTRLPISRR